MLMALAIEPLNTTVLPSWHRLLRKLPINCFSSLTVPHKTSDMPTDQAYRPLLW